MVEEVIQYLHNYFVLPGGVYTGTFAISDGSMGSLPLLDGQYFRVIGSVFNDGIHKYPGADMIGETFDGEIWAMAVPPSVIALSEEIKDFETNSKPSALTSESFGGYTYTRAAGRNGGPVTWRDVFGPRLNPWKKL